MNGCIYQTKDGECDLYAEGGKYTAFCETENCVSRKMSNADRIRSMTDEELAGFLFREEPWCTVDRECVPSCETCIENWLKEEVKNG